MSSVFVLLGLLVAAAFQTGLRIVQNWPHCVGPVML